MTTETTVAKVAASAVPPAATLINEFWATLPNVLLVLTVIYTFFMLVNAVLDVIPKVKKLWQTKQL